MSRNGSKVATHVLPKIPKLLTPPSYHQFLKNVLDAPENKPVLVQTGRSVIDSTFERLLPENVKDSRLQEHLSQIRSAKVSSTWERWRTRNGIVGTGLDLASLKLPRVGDSHKASRSGHTTGGEAWKYTTYAGFAEKCIKQNPEVKFDKQLLDEAFRAAASKAFSKKSRGGRAEGEGDIARCLGKESKEYWKDRTD